MPCKILLVTCSLAEKWTATLDTDNGHYPLGIGYLYSTLEQADHDVQLLFLNHVPYEACLRSIIDKIAVFQPQILGLSIITDSRVSSFRVIEHVQAHYPDIRIVLGGIHITTMYEQVATRFPNCILVLGEAEVTLCELVQALESGTALSTVQGIAYFDNRKVRRTPDRILIDDLDTLPYPKHTAFYTEKRNSAQVLTSRGCASACTFCVLDSFSRRKVRFRSALNVVDEIEYIVKTFPQTTRIQFLDDQFFADNKRVIAICDEIVRRGIKCSFECSGRMKPLCKEMVTALERAGFSNVYLGLESGSARILKRARKGITPQDVIRAMELFADSPINVVILLIIGLPGESIVTILETAKLIQELQKIKYHSYSHRIQTIFVYPGSQLYDMSKEAGAITDEYWLSDAIVPHYTVEHTYQELVFMEEILLTYISPIRLTTPGGLAAQKHLLPEIIRYAFCWKELYPIVNVVMHVTNGLLQSERISFTVPPDWAPKIQAEGGVHLSTLTRQRGTDGRFLINFIKIPITEMVKHTVEFAYVNNCCELTDLITAGVVEVFEQHINQGNRPDGLLARLGFDETWQALSLNQIGLRL
jgi:anaerobic magnesium-protoporphyrin IX monomethyl ester cyclase